MENSNQTSGNNFAAGNKFFDQMIEAGIVDDKFIREIVEMFLEEGEQTIASLKLAFKDNNIVNIRFFAHKLKSSFLMFDMNNAHHIVVKLEVLQEKDLKDAKNDFQNLVEIWSVDRKSLAKEFLV